MIIWYWRQSVLMAASWYSVFAVQCDCCGNQAKPT